LEIERLQEEQKELQCRLNVSQGHSLQQQDVAMRRLLNQQDEIIKMEKKLATLRRTGNIVDATQKSEAFEKQKATLENKLHHALVQFNEQLTKNAQLREDLEALRLQWIWFQQLQYKLDKELQEVHRDIGDMINQSTVTYDARVEAQSKMVQLKEKADKDLAQYSEEMKELESVIAHERRLKEFISTKSKERSSREDSLDPTHRQALEERERKRVEPGEEMLDSLEEVFHKIQSVTGEENLDLLASKFIQVEGQNFALFNYIIEQNNEAKSLRDQIEQIQQEMDQFHAEEQSQEAKYHKLLRDTDIQQREAEAQAQSYESQAVAANNILEQIKTGVDRMFRKLNCDLSALEDMLGSSTEIKDSNIMTYLSLIEKRTNELLSTQVLLSSKVLLVQWTLKVVGCSSQDPALWETGRRTPYRHKSKSALSGSLEIDRLQEEQEELQCRLQVSQSHSHQQQDVDTVQAMRRLLNQQDEVHEQLESQKESLVHLEQEILSMEKKLAGLRRTRTSVNLKQKSEASEKKKATRTLENKLDRTLVRFNEQLTKNAQLRADLETLRLERVRFQQLQRTALLTNPSLPFCCRVEAQSKMALLKEKAVKDLAQYSAEMKELERIIAHEQHLKDFMSTKSSDRSGHGGSLDPTHSQEPEERDHKRTEKGEDMVDSLEEVFHRIQSMTGEEDLDLLVSKFIQTEEQNFALFNYVNEQNNEAESLKDQIKQVQQEMGQFQAEEESQEARHCSLLTDIDTQQRKTEVRVQSYESQATEASKILDQIKTGVGRMFHKLECDFSVLEDMLGSSTEIRESNIMTYLSLVENRTNDLLSMQVFLNSKTLWNSLSLYSFEMLRLFLFGRDDIETEASLVTDEDDRPLTQKELRQRILTEVLQKEAAACSAGETDDKDSTINMVSSQQRRFQDLSLDVSPSLL
ncbi:hypothetical protein Z043_107365, partial [Scleropages formosus]